MDDVAFLCSLMCVRLLSACLLFRVPRRPLIHWPPKGARRKGVSGHEERDQLVSARLSRHGKAFQRQFIVAACEMGLFVQQALFCSAETD